jgi:hypothetical protein
MSLHKRIKAHIKHHLEKRHKHHMDPNPQTNVLETSITEKGNWNIKKPIIFVPLIILILSILIGIFLYFNKQTSLFIDPNTIDLTKGKIQTLSDYFGTYIEQAPEVCDQANLSKYFKSFVLPGEAGKPTQSQFASLYGVTIWNYILQGEITNIETVNNGIKYTLVSGEEKLITLATNKAISFVKDPTASPSSELTPTNINASTFAIKDKVYLYYLLKCGGNKSPLLFLEYVQKVKETPKLQVNTPEQPEKPNNSSRGLVNRADGLISLNGKVTKIENNLLEVSSSERFVKIIVPDNINIQLVIISEFSKNPDSYAQNAIANIPIEKIKKGDNIHIKGSYDGSVLNANYVLISR